MTGTISVVIPAFNAGSLIERCLRSVLAQKDAPEFEILVVDDGSVDNTLEVVESVSNERIRIFRQPENRGPAAARNRGLAEAKGEYLAFLDGDDFWEPDFLRETSDFLDSHPAAVAVSVMQCHKVIGKPPAISPRDTGIADPVMLENFFAFWAKYNHVCTGSVLMRTEIARSVGGQREDLRVCEDLEFWAMLATCGPWGFIPRVLFTSDGGEIVRKGGVREKMNSRMHHIKNIREWSVRLTPLLSETQMQILWPVFNRITLPGTYSLLRIGQYAAAYKNIQYYYPIGGHIPLAVKVSRCGFGAWICFAFVYRIYVLIKDTYNRLR